MPRILSSPCATRPAPPPRLQHCELAADPLAPGRLRGWITAQLTDWQLPHLVDDLALIATELATNALRHGGTAALATLSLTGPDQGPRTVRLEVQDSGPGFDPRECVPAAGSSGTADSCGGRGLLLVAALSTAWGTLNSGAGQLVWAEVTA
ncbi:ATP-binding protein [Kitasatospora indigofera]|uniref:ATP-binding protein n=1 Tax=Kitasatospora indigofera TaxID=67307 RepID=A0A919FX99_9ACTN|nr:ATP-binding protein [Kitasatospora indigofera]GHH73579.1 ATP-binding protein [Kitasatospora indigofera]